MKTVLVIYAIAIMLFGGSVAVANSAINEAVHATETERVYEGYGYTYGIQPAEQIVTTASPVPLQGNTAEYLEGGVNVGLGFLQGQ